MKNPLKKSICILSAGLMVMSSAALLTGCGKNTEESSETLSEEATTFAAFEWPDSEIAALLPTPKSTIGDIAWESSDGFLVYVAETPKDDYNDYVKKCRENGFTVDYTKDDDYYYADNKDGYNLSLNYDENDIMRISIDKPEEETTEESSKEESSKEESSKAESSKSESSKKESSKSESSSKASSDKVNSTLKKTLDAYEDFINDYVDFMKKYNESSDVAGMMADYTKYISEYADTMSKLGEIDQDELSAADLAYYTEVYARITKKLSEVD